MTEAGRALRESIEALRQREKALFESDPNCKVALGIAEIRTQLARLERGLPVLPDSVERAIEGPETPMPTDEPEAEEITAQ